MRKEERFLSSLVDLRLMPENARHFPDEEGKRRGARNCNILCPKEENSIYENFTIVDKKKSVVDKTLIAKSLGSHFTFASLMNDRQLQQLLLDSFKLCRVNKGEYLLKQDDKASSFFILHEGELVVEINGTQKRKIQSGQGFGELALLYSCDRSASIKAIKSSFLWFIDRSTFKKAIASLIKKNYQQTRKSVQDNQFFKQLTSSQKDKVASVAITQKFQAGAKVVKKGEMANSMYIVKTGKLSKCDFNKKNEQTKEKIAAGQIYGQYTFLKKNCQWEETVVAEQQSQIIALGVQDVQNVLGVSIPLIVIRNKVREIILKNEEFRKLAPHYTEIALDCFKIMNLGVSDKLDSKSSLFLVLEGDYKIINKDGTVQNVSCVSDKNKILHGSFSQQGNSIIIECVKNCKVAFAPNEDILKAFKTSYIEALQKSNAMKKNVEMHRDQLADIRSQCSKYSLKDYKFVGKLGQGQFGTVFLVTDPTKSKLYALKCISKSSAVNNKLQKYVINQKQILQQLSDNSPFCVNYIRSYKDQHFIYFLMEYIQGLELFDVIRIIGILNVEQTRFYGAIMVQMLETMHNKNIIYRDLKPENVMVTKDGYLKLIDMGTCKKMANKEGALSLRTFTTIGTPNYMAPEIIQGKGCSYSADLWSLGVVLFQFMAGYVPFGQDLDDPHQICQQILSKTLQFPSYMKDSVTNQFIAQLLNKSPDLRLGGSYSNLKRHQFLKNIQWDSLLSKKTKPAFIIPKNKLSDPERQLPKAKQLSSQLPSPSTMKVRKDYNPKWDECF